MSETIGYKQREAIRGSFATIHDSAEGNLKNARYNLRNASKAPDASSLLAETAAAVVELAFAEGYKEAVGKAVLLSRQLKEESVPFVLASFDEMYAHRLSMGVDTRNERTTELVMMAVHRLNGYGAAYRELREALVEALRSS